MNLIPILIEAHALPGYRLCLKYEDGMKGEVNLAGWVGKGVFEAWNNEASFSSFTITRHHKLEWSDVIDIDPDAFYLELAGKTFEEYARDKQVLRHLH